MSGSTNLGIDFGYRAFTPGSISGGLWEDADKDGVMDSGEPGIAGVTIDLYRDSNVNGIYDQGVDALVASAASASDGSYSFNGMPSGNLYYVRITDNDGVLTGYTATWEKSELLTGPFNGQESVTLNSDVTGVNFGFFNPIPTQVILSYFGAFERNGEVIVRWDTASEFDTLGFNLLRLDPVTGEYKQVNSGLLPAVLKPHRGGRYTIKDTGASPDKTYTYKLVEVEIFGREISYGPFTVSAGKKKDINGTGLFPDYTREERKQPQLRKALGEGIKSAQQLSAVATVGDRIKISVTDKGIYYVDAGVISSLLGIPPTEVYPLINSGQLSLSNRGKQVAYLPATNNAGMYFYATGIESVYTKENIYWIDRGTGTLMRVVHGAGPQPLTGEGSFADTVHFEQDLDPWETLFNDPNADYWFWSQLFASSYYTDSPWSYTFDVPQISDAESAAAFKVNLYGGSDAGVSNDHHVVVSLNGEPIAEEWWSGVTAHTIRATSSLVSGQNTITVKSMADPGVSSSFILIDSFDVTYQRLFEAEGDELFFKGEDARPVTVGGFSSPDIMVFNITNSLSPIFKTNTSIDAESETYIVSLNTPSAKTAYIAAAAGGIKNASAAAVVVSTLSSITNAADYIVIAPAALISTAQGLADYRAGQGLRAMVVNLEDIMNEFNFGIWSPGAIRKFLGYAHDNWTTGPRYVVLAGDGSMDYKDNMGLGGSLIPSKMVPTPFGLAMSDNYLADVNGDHMPEIAIGRLPVSSPDELEILINKIKTYELNIGNQSMVLVADTPDGGGDFISDSERLATLFPFSFSVNKIYLNDPAMAEEKKAALISAINGGAAFFNFVGHAGPGQLSNWGLLSYYPDDLPPADDLSLLTNASILPVMTAMTCGLANFGDPYQDVLGKALLLKPDGGTAATWSATGLSDDTKAGILNRGFYRAVLSGKKPLLGDAVREALSTYKKQGSMLFMMDIYCILGDPALRMR